MRAGKDLADCSRNELFSHFASLNLHHRWMSQFHTQPAQCHNGMDCVQQVLEFWDIYYWFDPLANSDSDTKSIKVSGQDGPLPKICLVLAFLARDIVSREVEVQFSPCPVILASLVLKLGLLELLNFFCTSCSKKVYKSEYCNTMNHPV